MGQVVAIDDIEDGMILSEPVINSFGQTLIPSGATLAVRHINMLKTWNIQGVSIKGDETEENFELSEELKTICIEKLSEIVKWMPRNENEEDLYNMGIQSVLRTIEKRS
ncbi:MAG: hypothetical protein HW421_3968 [Ignavibacteria bacterium]|nr:hypothetical protein [Ignavibacteria bacterium]